VGVAVGEEASSFSGEQKPRVVRVLNLTVKDLEKEAGERGEKDDGPVQRWVGRRTRGLGCEDRFACAKGRKKPVTQAVGRGSSKGRKEGRCKVLDAQKGKTARNLGTSRGAS